MSIRKKDNKPPFLSHQDERNMVFSWEYLTNNKTYGISRLSKESDNMKKLFEDLCEVLKRFSGIKYQEAVALPKNVGIELIPLNNCNKPFRDMCLNISIISNDSKLSVCRAGKYRVFFKVDQNQGHLLYLIAFDFDYNAYDHGG